MVENWKDIPGYEGLYQVSDKGNVKSLERTRVGKCGCTCVVKERILKPGKFKDGYLFVILCKNGENKMFTLHRLVALAFIPNDDPEHKTQVSHLDESRDNNCASNLCWCTSKENNNMPLRKQRGSESHIGNNSASKPIYCPELDMTFNSLTEAAKYVGVGPDAISNCLRGRSKHAGKHPVTGVRLSWQYKNEVAA